MDPMEGDCWLEDAELSLALLESVLDDDGDVVEDAVGETVSDWKLPVEATKVVVGDCWLEEKLSTVLLSLWLLESGAEDGEDAVGETVSD